MTYDDKAKCIELIVKAARLQDAIDEAKEKALGYYEETAMFELLINGVCCLSSNCNDVDDFNDYSVTKMLRDKSVSSKTIAEHILEVIMEEERHAYALEETQQP